MARTKGARNVDAVVVQHLSRCPACGSTDRAPYANRSEEECVCTIGERIPVTHIVRRLTRCLSCGQARIDATFENRSAADGGILAD